MTINRLNTIEFKDALDSWEHTLLDVRTKQEQDIFWVISEKQVHIDVYKPEALEHIKKLPREGKYLIYCYHGNRSQQVASLMQELWFWEVYDLIGWIDEWKKSN